MGNKLRCVILKNELENDHLLWKRACDDFSGKVEYRIVDITRDDWFVQLEKFQYDVLLAKPSGVTNSFKQLYDERILVLHQLGKNIFPSLTEILIYENKRFCSFWMQANQVPHPKTHVFYHLKEALSFIQTSHWPLVTKTNIGASGSGVVVLKNQSEARDYIEKLFSGEGAKKRIGPNMQKGGWVKRISHYLFHPEDVIKKYRFYQKKAADVQKDFVILQEYVPHEYEWRVVRIGESFFAHKKLKLGEKASGSLLKNYDNPPIELIQFVKDFTDQFGFYSQAVDIFDSPDGFLINEAQCIFGQSDSFQMMVDGKVGRYIFENEQWIFEEGDFNRNESYNLRVKYVIDNFEQ
jgi:glutathione synthase/RimK-type ligase-like ATP-grasp enzyme